VRGKPLKPFATRRSLPARVGAFALIEAVQTSWIKNKNIRWRLEMLKPRGS